MDCTYQDYLDGKCSAEEYMRAEYITRNFDKRWQQAEMTVVDKDGHLYFIFSVPNDFINKHVDGTDYIIRDMENGVRDSAEDRFYPYTGEEFFWYCYENHEGFRKYVDKGEL